MTRDVFVYGLVDPRTRALRYIGQTINGKDRPSAHWKRTAILNHKDRCHTWIRKLKSQDLVPEIVILERCEIEDLNKIEMFWISSVRATGSQLLNMTDGGEGTHGFHWDDEAKKRIGDRHRGKKLSAEHLAAWKAAITGITHSAQTSEKRAARFRGRKARVKPPSRKGIAPVNKGSRNGFKIINDLDGQIFESARSVSRFYSVAYGTIRALLKGKRQSAYPQLKLRILDA